MISAKEAQLQHSTPHAVLSYNKGLTHIINGYCLGDAYVMSTESEVVFYRFNRKRVVLSKGSIHDLIAPLAN